LSIGVIDSKSITSWQMKDGWWGWVPWFCEVLAPLRW